MCRLKHSITPVFFSVFYKIGAISSSGWYWAQIIYPSMERERSIDKKPPTWGFSAVQQPFFLSHMPVVLNHRIFLEMPDFLQVFEDFTSSCRWITPPATPACPEHLWCGSSHSAASGCAETVPASVASSFFWHVLTATGATGAEVPAFPQAHSGYILLTLYWQEAFRARCRLEQVFLPASDYFSFYRPAVN